MCDGKVNHFHVQLIPRYPDAIIGSKNFVKPRMDYIEDNTIVRAIRERLATIE